MVSAHALRQRAENVLGLLKKRYPEPPVNLVARNPWEQVVATVLSAQCTDARVNKVTPELFRRWPSPEALACADQADVEEVIRAVGFYHSKAANIIMAARRVCDTFGGEVPHTLEELVTLPGVARKTANVVLWTSFGINEGLAVDTHVKRIAGRLGLTRETDPVKVERNLMDLFPREEWGMVNHLMVWFGREVCIARKPLCPACEMAAFCPARQK